MGKDLDIKYTIDDSQPRRSAEASIRAVDRLTAAWKRAGDAQEQANSRVGTSRERADQKSLESLKRSLESARKAAEAAAESQIRAAQRAADADVKANARREQAAQKAADKVIVASQRAADATARAAQKSVDADLKAAMARADASTRAGQKAIEAALKRSEAEKRAAQRSVDAEVSRVTRLDALGRQQLSKEEVQLRARAQANQKYQQQRVDAAARIVAGEDEATSASGRLGDAATRIAAGFVGLQAAEALIRGIGNAISESREKSIEWAQSLLKVKDDLAELATLRGLAFADDTFIKKMVGFSKATGLSVGQSDQFQRQLYGSAAGGLQLGNIDQDTLDRAAVLTGQAASRQTKDFSTRGDLVGMLTQSKKYDKGDVGAKQVASNVEAVRLGLTEGRGDDGPLTRSFLNVYGTMIGEGMPVKDEKQLAALIGVTSLTAGPLAADTRADQLYRGLRGATPKQMGFLKDFAGIDEHDMLENRLDKIIPKLREQRAKGRDVGTFLIENGMNEEQSRGLLEQVNGGYEIFKERLKKANNPVSGETIAGANKAFEESPVGRQKKGDAALYGAQLDIGKNRQNLEAEMPAAEAELVGEGLDTNPLNHFGNFMRSISSGFTVSGRRQRIEERALQRLRERAGMKAGASPYGMLEDSGTPFLQGGSAFNAAAQGFGTDINAEAANYYEIFAQMLKELQKQTEELQKRNPTQPARGGLPAAPPPLSNARPAGGYK